jgi:hypothetical protein
MADSSDNIEVKFGADASELSQGVDAANEKVNEIGGSAEGLMGKLEALGGAIAAAFTIDKIAEFTHATAEAAEKMELMQAKTGLAVSTIQDMQFAMKRMGGDGDAAGAVMARFERNVYEAAAGSGAAFEAFQKLGLSAQELQHLDLDTLLRKWLDGLAGVTDASTRNALAIATGGRAAADFAASLSGGSKAIDEAHKKLVDMNAEMSPEQVKNYAELAKDFTDLGTAASALGRTILDNFVEPIKTSIEWLSKAISKTSEFISMMSQANEAESASEKEEEDFEKGGLAAVQNKKDAGKGASGSWGDAEAQAPAKPQQDINRNPEGQKKTSDALAAEKEKEAEEAAKEAEQEAAEKEAAWEQETAAFDVMQGKYRQGFAEQYENKKATDQLEVASGKMSQDEMYSDLQKSLAKEQADVDKSFQASMAQYGKDCDAYKELRQEKENVDQKFANDHLALTIKQTTEDSKSWKTVSDTFSKNMSSMVQGVMTGTQTIGQAFGRMCGNMILSFAQAITKMGVDWAAGQIRQLMVSQATQAQQTALVTASQTAQTAATTAGATERTAVQTAATTTAATTQAAADEGSILKSASTAAAGAYSSVAQIPYVGWLLAPAAAAGAFAATAAFGSFEVGTDYVPHDMMAMVHQGERITPASANVDNKGAKPYTPSTDKDAEGSGDSHVHFHVNAMDSKDVGHFFDRHAPKLARAISGQMRAGNLKPAGAH